MKRKRMTRYVLVLSILMIAVLLMGASCSVSTANVKNAVMTTNVDENASPVNNVTSFPVNSDVYVSAELHNAPEGTTITFKWYVNDELIDEVSIGNEGYTDAPLTGHIPPEFTSQPGNYKVEIYIDDREDPDTVTEFVVE